MTELHGLPVAAATLPYSCPEINCLGTSGAFAPLRVQGCRTGIVPGTLFIPDTGATSAKMSDARLFRSEAGRLSAAGRAQFVETIEIVLDSDSSNIFTVLHQQYRSHSHSRVDLTTLTAQAVFTTSHKK
jgi:hypothetical protein